jgi:hypothetical protein
MVCFHAENGPGGFLVHCGRVVVELYWYRYYVYAVIDSFKLQSYRYKYVL